MIYWHRFHESRYSEARLMLLHLEFPVIKETPCGVWLDVYGSKRFVLRSARKRYACPTADEALASYHARKRRQIKILKHRLAEAEAALQLTKDGEMVYHGLGA